MSLGDLIIQSSKAILSRQLADGSFPPGWNGPYHDPETPAPGPPRSRAGAGGRGLRRRAKTEGLGGPAARR